MSFGVRMDGCWIERSQTAVVELMAWVKISIWERAFGVLLAEEGVEEGLGRWLTAKIVMVWPSGEGKRSIPCVIRGPLKPDRWSDVDLKVYYIRMSTYFV
jgi:hypothetical protein